MSISRQNLKYAFFIFLLVLLVLNTVMTCILTVWIGADRTALKHLQVEIFEIKCKVEEEIRLREDLFPKLKKSAQLLKKYNPNLNDEIALGYALKIYECSDDEVSLNILTALIVVESSANHRAVSRKGALGLTQVMPGIWKCDREILVNPYKNIEIGSSILRYYIKRFGLIGGLSAYNSGKRHASLPYARKVLTIAERHF